MPRLPAEKHIAADPARTGIVEPVPNTAVIFEIRNLGVIPISIMEDRRLDIQTFDLASGCRQSHERILTSGEERSLIVKIVRREKRRQCRQCAHADAHVSTQNLCGGLQLRCPCFLYNKPAANLAALPKLRHILLVEAP